MKRIPRAGFVTLMAAAAGVSVSLASSMATPTQALARTPTSLAADTLPGSKPAAAARKAAAPAPAKVAASAKAETKAAASKPAAKAVVATAGPNNPSPNDACGSEADCRNINGDGAGY